MNLPDLKNITVNGFTITYRQWGESGIPIMMLHGIPTSSIIWHKCATYLSQFNYVIYAPDMLGIGGTTGPISTNHSIEGQAEIFQLFANTLFPNQPYHLIGHDLGGGVAQVMVHQFSDNIASLTLSNCFAFDTWPIKQVKPFVSLARMPSVLFNIFTPLIHFLFKKALSKGVKDKSAVNQDILNSITQHLFASGAKKRHFQKVLAGFDNKITQRSSPSLKSFDRPILVLWGSLDKYHPVSTGKRLKDLNKKIKMFTFEADHYHPLDQDDIARIFIREMRHI